MTKHTKYIVSIVVLVLIAIFINFVFYVKNNFNNRGNTSLINQYYKLRDNYPLEAKKALDRLLINDPNNLVAMRELGFWYVRQGDTNSALKQFILAHNTYPDNLIISLQLGKLYLITKQYEEAKSLLTEVSKTNDLNLKQKAQIALSQIPDSSAPSPTEERFANNTIGNLQILTMTNNSMRANTISKPVNEVPGIPDETSPRPQKLVCRPASTAMQSPTAARLATNSIANLQILTMTPSTPGPAIDYAQPIPEIYSDSRSSHPKNNQPLANLPLIAETRNRKAPMTTTNERDTLFNQYYALKKQNPHQAWSILQTILKKYPTDLDALKEAGYTTLNANNNAAAYGYFKRAYEITRDPQLAMQLGYIAINLDKKRLAYYYFDLATNTHDTKTLINAEMAKTNLTQAQMKILPEPYYADIYFDPFYYSRFKMVVKPLSVEVGKIIDEKNQLKVYLNYKRITDDRSNLAQGLPQIFQDNYSLLAAGAKVNPIPNSPLTLFAQAGKATDLVYQNRSRWRSDFRGGAAFYKDWGEKPTYVINPIFSKNEIGDFYSDMIYFSRYRDVIGSVRLREGVRLFKYETSSIDLYLKGFLVWDTAHQFYNNIFEWGPGIALTPSNRYNVVLHLEALQGHYIPVSSPTSNPYSSNYHNNLLLLDMYFRL